MYVLLFVLWVLAAAVTFGFLDAANTSLSTRVVRGLAFRIEHFHDAKPVLKEFMQVLKAFNSTLPDVMELSVKGIHWRAQVEDVGSKLNVNQLKEEELRFLLRQCGVDNRVREDALVDAFLDWRDEDDFRRLNGAEKEYYLELAHPYEPRNGNILDDRELLLIKGMDVRLFACLKRVISVYGTGKVNINSVDRDTLEIMGFSEREAEFLAERREKEPIRSFQELEELVPGVGAFELKEHFAFRPSGILRVRLFTEGKLVSSFVVDVEHSKIIRYE